MFSAREILRSKGIGGVENLYDDSEGEANPCQKKESQARLPVNLRT